jgi:uncharacterized membrane protein YciS (DUF1049 family)
MKKIILFLVVFVHIVAFGQNVEQCGTMLYKRIQTEQNISAANAYFKAETDAANWIKNNKEAVHKSKTVGI